MDTFHISSKCHLLAYFTMLMPYTIFGMMKIFQVLNALISPLGTYLHFILLLAICTKGEVSYLDSLLIY
jgi:hypothetical protein